MKDLAFGIKNSFVFELDKQWNIPAERGVVPQQISIYFIYCHSMEIFLVLHKIWLSSYPPKLKAFGVWGCVEEILILGAFNTPLGIKNNCLLKHEIQCP